MTETDADVPRVRVRRTPGLLADGRELIYFDDSEPYVSGQAARSFDDQRDLERPVYDSRMRLDDLTGEWVAFATHRMDRTHLPPADLCPLCPTASWTSANGDPERRLRRRGVREPFPFLRRRSHLGRAETVGRW